MSRHDSVSAQPSNVCITCHAALNAIACMCETISDVTSSNVLGRLVQCEQKHSAVGRGDSRGFGWTSLPGQKNYKMSTHR